MGGDFGLRQSDGALPASDDIWRDLAVLARDGAWRWSVEQLCRADGQGRRPATVTNQLSVVSGEN